MYRRCPHCNTNITSVEIKPIDVNENMGPKWNGVAYTCSNMKCNAILSVGIVEDALARQIRENIEKQSL